MHNRDSVSEIRGFIRWTMDQNDIDLLDDSKRFLQQLYIFAKMRYGGREYAYQQELLQLKAERLIRRAETINRHMIPLAIQIIAGARRTDRMILDLARECAVVACELLDLKPLNGCPEPCRCALSSTPPA